MALTLKPTVTVTEQDIANAIERRIARGGVLSAENSAKWMFEQLQFIRAGLDMHGKPVNIGHVSDPGDSESGETVSEQEREPAPPQVKGGVMHGDELTRALDELGEGEDPNDLLDQLGSPHGDPGERKIGKNPSLAAPYGTPYGSESVGGYARRVSRADELDQIKRRPSGQRRDMAQPGDPDYRLPRTYVAGRPIAEQRAEHEAREAAERRAGSGSDRDEDAGR